MYTRPIFTIASMLFRPFVNYVGMQAGFLPIYNILWNSTAGLITALGTTNTFRVLYRMNRFLRTSGSTVNTTGNAVLPENLIRLVLPVLNPTGNNIATRVITETFLSPLLPHFPSIIENRHITIKILYFIMSTITFLFVRPIIGIVLRSVLSLFVSATCILWSESLRGFKALFNYALTVRDLFAPYISIPIPDVVRQNLPSFNTSKILLTGFILFTTLIGVDLLSPINFESFPIIGWIFHGAYSYFLIPLACNLRIIYEFTQPIRSLYNRYIGWDVFIFIGHLFRRNR